MSKTGRYIGGHTLVGPANSSWFSKGSTTKKKAKSKKANPRVAVSVLPSPVKLITKEEMEQALLQREADKAAWNAESARREEKKKAARAEKRAARKRLAK
ncbi:hypothetical protein [Dongia sp.]|uniref:hypothetical protein n=1 Tax=Dongia sp. TaxID=1977262 RepID=UPI0035B01422